jgi:putative transposase
MARPTRWVMPMQLHHVMQRMHGQHQKQQVSFDDEDRALYLQALKEAAAQHHVKLHAYALLDHEVRWLATPRDAQGLSLVVQAIGQRFVMAFNRRHGFKGSCWDGRFGCSVLEERLHGLEATLLLSRLGGDRATSSAAHNRGVQRQPWLVDLPGYWQLGNTPFEREARFAKLLVEPADPALAQALAAATRRGRPLGSSAFVAEVAKAAGRPTLVRPRGRPKKVSATVERLG